MLFRSLFVAAEYAFRQAIQLCPDSPEANYRLAQLYVQRGQFDSAVDVLEKYQRTDENNTKIRDTIKTVRDMRDQINSTRDLEQKYAGNPNDLQAGWDLAVAYARQQRLDAMDAVVSSLVTRPEFTEQLFLQLAQVYAQLKRLDRVTDVLSVMAQRFPSNNMAWYNLAAVYSARGDCASAAVSLQRALALDTPERVVYNTALRDERLAGCRNARCIFCWLLGYMEVHHPTMPIGDDHLEIVRMHRAHAVWCETDRPVLSPFTEEIDAVEPRIHRAVRESDLLGERFGLVETGVQIGGVEQCEFHASTTSRIHHRPTHLIGVRVAATVDWVVDVVEFSDPGDARECHLGKHRGRERPIVVRSEAIGDRVHRFAPRPKVPGTTMGVSAKRAMERMAV